MESKMLWSGYSFDAGLVGPLVPPLATEVLGGCVAVSGGVADGTAVLAADGTAVRNVGAAVASSVGVFDDDPEAVAHPQSHLCPLACHTLLTHLHLQRVGPLVALR